jgi:inhibitor of Bruton tyrosine kinase
LKRYGASFDIFDSDFYTPLQLIPEARILQSRHSVETNAFFWGKNKNYNLGLGSITSRAYPDAIKNLPSVNKASINKYHSLLLTSLGSVWGCGHSKDGRLGVGSNIESTLTCPQEIRIKLNSKSERIIGVSCGLHHSLIYTNKSVYATGSNKHLQLGIKNVDFVSEFKEVPLDKAEVDFKRMLDVLACDFHSLIVSRSGVFICGLNVGQFGGIQEVGFEHN